MSELAQDGDRQSSLLAMQMEALYKGAPQSVMSIFGAAIVVLTYWSTKLQFSLILWFAITCVIAFVHIGTTAMRPENGLIRWQRLSWSPYRWSPVAWSRFVRLVHFCSGTCWGVGGGWLLLNGDHHQTLVVCCIAMGGVTVTIPAVIYRPAFNLFQVPVFIFFAVALAVSDVEYGKILAFASATLSVALAIMSHSMGEQMTLAFKLLQENRHLTDALAARGSVLEEENRELTAQTMTDPLTGLANRRRLMEFLRRTSGRCAVLIVDVDHFKSYNDNHGHGDGDICLVLVADALRRSVQPSVDLVARLGGEEFVVVLTDLSHQRALDVAELIRANIQALAASHPLKIRRLVTASIGLAYRDDDRQKSNTDLMTEADGALYTAKNTGRNRVATLSGNQSVAAGRA
ncbi:diguanylate cyclase (GGDEF) domain-containing protein [Rhizobium sp. NFR07]|uniref:GGDEF domain-containing protein n=1 Tax=Rhizobium sp. NFR07 TaxID=1566262 RepID=UPI0008EE3818|nr:GGDEF domain-containing protein [Rhizobium sp. NFR07]SFB46070.1 diguanylate cyclase (GGDEF) domain-containing protein [Rhizobium sp. NFR07]